MRRLYVTLMFCAAFLSVVSTPAQAISWEWVDQLSGPGPFWGVESDFRVVCFGNKDEQVGIAAVGIESACLSGRKIKHKGSLNLTAAIDFAKSNNLPYEGRNVSTKVRLLRLGPSIKGALLARTLELSAGVEWDYFWGTAFDNFSRLAVPLLIDYKPFVSNRDNDEATWQNSVTLRVGVVIIPTGFDAKDFGAIPGSFHTSSEVLPTIGVIWDLGHRR